MRLAKVTFILTILCSFAVSSTAQSPDTGTPAQASPTAPAVPAAPSGLLQPSLDTVQQTMTAMKLDKWKRGTVRDEAGTNISAILRDVQTNLPPLLAAADAAPGSMSKVLPVTRNVDALYDVLLRVVEAARVSSPGDQLGQLELALTGLQKARLALDDGLQDQALAQEKQLSDLRASVEAMSAAKTAEKTTPAASNCTAPTPAKKPKKKRTTPATVHATGAKPSPSSANATPAPPK
jgi:hypothetical protein